MTNQTKAFLCAVSTVLMWSTVSTAFKLALNEAHTLSVLSYAMLVAGIVLFFYVLLTKEYKKIFQLNKTSWLRLGYLTAILYLYHIVLFLGYAGLPVQIALPINYFWTVLLAIFGAVFLRQKLSKKSLFWLFFAFSGIIFIGLGSDSKNFSIEFFSLFCIACSSVLYALYWILTAKEQGSPILKIFICFFLCAVIGFINLYVCGMPLTLPPKALYPTVYIGLFELSIPFILWYYAMTRTDSVSRIATLPLCSPFLSLLWAYMFLNEQIQYINLLGLSIIIFGTLMQQKSQK